MPVANSSRDNPFQQFLTVLGAVPKQIAEALLGLNEPQKGVIGAYSEALRQQVHGICIFT